MKAAICILLAALLSGCSGSRLIFGYEWGKGDIGGNNARTGRHSTTSVQLSVPVGGPREVVIMKEPRNLYDTMFRPAEPLFGDDDDKPSNPMGDGGDNALLWTLIATGVLGGGGGIAWKVRRDARANGGTSS